MKTPCQTSGLSFAALPARQAFGAALLGLFASAGFAQNCDINRDGVVNYGDLDQLMACFGSTVEDYPQCATSDLTNDGNIDMSDVAVWLGSCAGSNPTVDLVAVTVDAAALDMGGDTLQARKQYLPISGDVIIEVRNDGTSASGDFQVAVFEDDNRDGVFQPGAPSIEEGTLLAVASLAPGESRSVTVPFAYQFNQPVNGTPPREFFANRISVVADPQNLISETNESNNLTLSAAHLAAADLTASRIRPQYSQPGVPPTVDFDVRIGNGGSSVAPAGLRVKWYNGNPATGGTLVDTQLTPAPLAPGEYVRMILAFDFHYVFDRSIWVIVDDTTDGVIVEADEQNNQHNWSCYGDIDFDNEVSIADLALLLSNYGTQNAATYVMGDLNVDTDISLDDLASMLAVFGTMCD